LKKIGFIFSNLYILLGAITLIITSILNEVMPHSLINSVIERL